MINKNDEIDYDGLQHKIPRIASQHAFHPENCEIEVLSDELVKVKYCRH